MDLILIHGMGRTPLSMLHLRNRLRRHGFNTCLFGYSPTFETLEHACNRLAQIIQHKINSDRYALIGHSLGTVLIRHTLSKLNEHKPAACFFLAPPMVACKAAKKFTRFRLFRLLTREMGTLLAQDQFMDELPIPSNTRIYVGMGGPRASWLPHGITPNDGILTVDEAIGIAATPWLAVPASHTFIMNSKIVSEDIANSLLAL